MWVKVKKTGVMWHIGDEVTKERVMSEPNQYEVIEDGREAEQGDSEGQATEEKLENIPEKELRKKAQKLGIRNWHLKRVDNLIKEMRSHGE